MLIGSGLLSFVVITYCWYRKNQKNRKLPKGYRDPVDDNKLEEEDDWGMKRSGEDLIKDRYRLDKIPEIVDAIVIGSGIGGLSAAAFLARVGRRVLVLEQHDRAGGATHVFKDHGFEHETGIHYIGNIASRQKVLNLITDSPIQWSQLGQELNDPDQMVYDELFIGQKDQEGYLHHQYRAGVKNFMADLIAKFPNEKKAIREYVDLIKKVSQKDTYFLLKILKPVWIRRLVQRFFCNDFYYYINKSALEVIEELTTNRDLIAILCGQFGDYGPTPDKASFFIHASIVNHYLEGGFYPTGGSGQFAQQIIPVIERAGGRVLVNARVRHILLENADGTKRKYGDDKSQKCYGVLMDNGDEIYAPIVISDAGVGNTYGKLISSKIAFRDCHWGEIQKKIPSSCSFVFLFVGLNGNPDELGLRSANFWVYPEKDYANMLANFKQNPWVNPMPLFIASAAAKDSEWSKRNPDKSSVILLTMADPKWFRQWKNQRCTRRDDKYQNLKTVLGDRMLNEGLLRFYPHLKDKIAYHSIGTPLTIQHYLGSVNGEAYGLDCNSARFDAQTGIHLEPRTGVEGLYLTGQDVCTLGFTGALMGGCLTASEILGYGTLSDLWFNRNLIDDLTKLG